MRTIAVVKRILQQIVRDKRTLVLLFIAPIFILSLMNVLFEDKAVEPKLGVINIDKGIVSALERANINVIEYENSSKDIIIENKLSGLIEISDGKMKLTLENADPAKSKELLVKINQAILTQAKGGKDNDLSQMKNKDIEVNYLYGNSDTSFFDVLSPILIGYFVFFFVFIISGIGILGERTRGTLERILATPILRREILAGYLVGYGILAVLQTMVIVLFSIKVLNIVLVGSIWNVILINLVLALVALSLGILLSTFASSEFQMMQFIPVVIVPQMFFTGIFPFESMPNWLQVVAKMMPIYYSSDALKGVMYKGWGLREIRWDLCALTLYIVIFIILNTFALRKYRKL